MVKDDSLTLWARIKDRWRLWGPWRRTLMLLNVVLILNLLLMLGAWGLHPLIIVAPTASGLALVIRFPFLLVFVLPIVGSASSAVITPLGQFPDKRFRVVALFMCSWIGTITYLVCLYFQNLWVLSMSPLVESIPFEPYPGYWAQNGLINIIMSHFTLIPTLMLLGFFGMVIAYLFQYAILF